MTTTTTTTSSAAASPPAIAVRHVSKRYGAFQALSDVGFDVPRGALCGLIGPNGAGKTTLFSIMATLDEDFSGDVEVAGASVKDAQGDVRARIGWVPDYSPLYDTLLVREMLEVFAQAAGVPRPKRRGAVDRVVELCGLHEIVGRPAAGLSKGQAQRVCVARALLHDPEVLLLDEPAAGLDPRARIELKELLKRLGAQQKTVLVSSHILTELGDFCDHVVVLEHGKVVAAGRIDELAEQHDDAPRDERGARRRVLVEIAGDAERAASLLRVLDCVVDVVVDGQVLAVWTSDSGATGQRHQARARIARVLVEGGIDVLSLVPEKKNLEALFLVVTGKASEAGRGGGA